MDIRHYFQINIPKGGTGYSYSKVFGPYLDDTVTEVALRDPYIRSTGQVIFSLIR